MALRERDPSVSKINVTLANVYNKPDEAGRKNLFGISELDNAVTTLYKIAAVLGDPIEYILLKGDSTRNYAYITVADLISLYLTANIKLEDFYLEISDRFPELEWREIALVYYDTVMVLDKACRKSEDVEEKTREYCGVLASEKNVLTRINKMFEAIREADDDRDEDLAGSMDAASLKIEYKQWSEQNKARRTNQRRDFERIETVQEELSGIAKVKYYDAVIDMTTYRFRPLIWDISVDGKRLASSHRPSLEEGIEIFRQAKVSEDIPYIQYNTKEGRNLYWIYEDVKHNKLNAPSNYLDHISQSTRPNTIYLLLWLNKELSEKAARTSLIKCMYYIDTAELILKAPKKGGGLAALRAKLELAFPLLILGKEEQIRVQGYFEVENIIVNEASYHFMLNTDIVHRMYLYIDESARALADKQRPNVHYRSLVKRNDDTSTSASVSISFAQFTAENDYLNTVPESASPIALKAAQASGRLRINVTKAESLEVLKQFQEVFCRLLARYREQRVKIEDYITHIIPEYKGFNVSGEIVATSEGDDSTSSKKKKGSSILNDTKNRNLRRRVPDVIVPGYARACQCRKQPLVIKRDEVEEWRNYRPITGKGSKQRQVMPYPPLEANEDGKFDDPLTLDPYDERVKHWFVCPDNKIPYPALKSSVVLPNKDKYPYIPCCGHQDSLSDNNSPYYFYHDREHDTHGVKTAKYFMSTMKILKIPGRTGKIGKVLTQLLASHLSGEEANEVYNRYGVPVDSNSLIHCVLTAVRDAGYLRLKPEDRGRYAQQVRNYIAKNLNPLLFKQELYDSSPEEIVAELENEELEFASEKFYRGLEEVFNVNIFVFNPGSTPDRPAGSEDKLVIEIPRSKISHIRPYRADRQTVLVFKHWGTEVNKIPYPHCELIVSAGKNKTETEGEEEEDEDRGNKNKEVGNLTYIFDESMNRVVYQTLFRSMQAYVWSCPESKGESLQATEIVTRVNPFSRIEWERLFANYRIVGQRIDTYGKLRTLGLEVKKGVVMSVFVPPAQPLNVPYLEEIKPVAERLALSIFGLPSGIAPQGLWYSILDYTYGLYIPTLAKKTIEWLPESKAEAKISHASEEDDFLQAAKETPFTRVRLKLQVGQERLVTEGIPEAPVTSQTIHHYPIETMRIAKRNMYYMIQIVNWLWLLEAEPDDASLNRRFADWWQEWVVANDETVSSEVVDVPNLPIKLPEASSTKEGILAMNKLWPAFFRVEKKKKARLHFYPALGQKLFLFFKRREEVMGRDRRNTLKTYNFKFIQGVYIWEMDFLNPEEEKKSNSGKALIFLTTHQLQVWITTQSKKSTSIGTQNPISQRADPSQVFSGKPYIYTDDLTGKTYIIQNVKGGELNRALNVCQTWLRTAKNIGFTASSVNKEVPPYVIYSISPEERLVQIKDHSSGDPNYYHVLRYTLEGRYAAMLPLI